jgi:hypothetical protein
VTAPMPSTSTFAAVSGVLRVKVTIVKINCLRYIRDNVRGIVPDRAALNQRLIRLIGFWYNHLERAILLRCSI